MDCMMEPNFLSIHEAVQLVRDGKLPPHALTEACVRQIERLNPTLNAFITLQRIENRELETSHLASGHLLSGIPIAIKDLFETKGIKTTAGSKFFADYVPTQDAAAVQKLKEAGAVILGKTNTHEIALGVTSNNPHFGACRNPWDTTRIPGGSSGGSAAAVASGMALAALGTDTGGSIRIPAALCGVVGLKPTYGRVSLRGVIPLSWNLDHAGPMARCVRDVAILLDAIAGYDPDDPASADVPTGDYLTQLDGGIRGWRIAQASDEFFTRADEQVVAAVQAAAGVLAQLGAKVTPVEFPEGHAAAATNGALVTSDAAAFHRQRLEDQPGGFGSDVLQRLQMGAARTSSEYALLRREQSRLRRLYERFFEGFDLLITPSTPVVAPPIEGPD